MRLYLYVHLCVYMSVYVVHKLLRNPGHFGKAHPTGSGRGFSVAAAVLWGFVFFSALRLGRAHHKTL